MVRFHPVVLVLGLLMGSGLVKSPASAPSTLDGGLTGPTTQSDGGSGTPAPHESPEDGGVADSGSTTPPHDGGGASPGVVAEGVRWPDEVQPLATLDGPAVLAAHAVLQRVLARMPEAYAGTCEYSARAMEVIVGRADGLYFVRVNHRLEACGHTPLRENSSLDWFELYAVSPEGRVLARYPYFP